MTDEKRLMGLGIQVRRAELERELDQLAKLQERLQNRKQPAQTRKRKRKPLSADVRRKMSEAAKRRWADRKAAAKRK
jgi:predicted  nucleic acid-binding Zn-ribbon protein